MFTIEEYPDICVDTIDSMKEVFVDSETIILTVNHDNIQALLNGKMLLVQLDENQKIVIYNGSITE